MKTRTVLIALTALALAAVALVGCSEPAEKKMVGIVTTAEASALQVDDQPGAGAELEVARVLAPDPSWVVVHLDDNGKPGERVGLLHVDKGESTGIAVELKSGVELTDKLIVALHADRATPGTFDFDMEKFEASPDKPYFIDGKELAVVVSVR